MVNDFGEKITSIVKEVSEDKDPKKEQNKKATWQSRKEKYLVRLENSTYEAMMVCAADKIHNLSSMIEAYNQQGNNVWKKFNAPKDKKYWFYEKVRDILKERLNNSMIDELNELLIKIQKIL